MGLTKRKDGWYVEFPVLDDGKVLTLARGTPGPAGGVQSVWTDVGQWFTIFPPRTVGSYSLTR